MDENQGAPSTPAAETAPQQPDQIKNLKAEMDRKLSNIEAQNAQMQAFIASLNKPQAVESQTKKVSVFENEEAYARQIQEEAEARIMQKLSAQQEVQNKKQATLNALVADFPELTDSSHEMTKKAIEIFNSLPADEQAHPLAYKTAVKEAALDLGIKPKSKRNKEGADESFSLSGNSAPRPAKKDSIPPAMAELAKAFGLEMTPERKERLAKKHNRKTYRDWE